MRARIMVGRMEGIHAVYWGVGGLEKAHRKFSDRLASRYVWEVVLGRCGVLDQLTRQNLAIA